MYSIQVTLLVLKALTDRLSAEGQTFDDILRELLEIESEVVPENQPQGLIGALTTALNPHVEAMTRMQHGKGFISRSLFLPSGTELRARYKGKLYEAKIVDEKWVDSDGRVQSSPSAAATVITKTSVNGLRFWEAKRPSDTVWRRLDFLVG